MHPGVSAVRNNPVVRLPLPQVQDTKVAVQLS